MLRAWATKTRLEVAGLGSVEGTLLGSRIWLYEMQLFLERTAPWIERVRKLALEEGQEGQGWVMLAYSEHLKDFHAGRGRVVREGDEVVLEIDGQVFRFDADGELSGSEGRLWQMYLLLVDDQGHRWS